MKNVLHKSDFFLSITLHYNYPTPITMIKLHLHDLNFLILWSTAYYLASNLYCALLNASKGWFLHFCLCPNHRLLSELLALLESQTTNSHQRLYHYVLILTAKLSFSPSQYHRIWGHRSFAKSNSWNLFCLPSSDRSHLRSQQRGSSSP